MMDFVLLPAGQFVALQYDKFFWTSRKDQQTLPTLYSAHWYHEMADAIRGTPAIIYWKAEKNNDWHFIMNLIT